VCVPAASELSDVGLVHAAAVPPSSLHVTEVALLVVQANVAPVEVVDEGGVCVKEMVGAFDVVTVEIVQLSVAVAVPPGPVAVATKVCVPAASELSEVGLVHAAAVPLSSLHVTEVALLVVQANVAAVEVVEEGGA